MFSFSFVIGDRDGEVPFIDSCQRHLRLLGAITPFSILDIASWSLQRSFSSSSRKSPLASANQPCPTLRRRCGPRAGSPRPPVVAGAVAKVEGGRKRGWICERKVLFLGGREQRFHPFQGQRPRRSLPFIRAWLELANTKGI